MLLNETSCDCPGLIVCLHNNNRLDSDDTTQQFLLCVFSNGCHRLYTWLLVSLLIPMWSRGAALEDSLPEEQLENFLLSVLESSALGLWEFVLDLSIKVTSWEAHYKKQKVSVLWSLLLLQRFPAQPTTPLIHAALVQVAEHPHAQIENEVKLNSHWILASKHHFYVSVIIKTTL